MSVPRYWSSYIGSPVSSWLSGGRRGRGKAVSGLLLGRVNERNGDFATASGNQGYSTGLTLRGTRSEPSGWKDRSGLSGLTGFSPYTLKNRRGKIQHANRRVFRRFDVNGDSASLGKWV